MYVSDIKWRISDLTEYFKRLKVKISTGYHYGLDCNASITIPPPKLPQINV